MSGFPSRTTTSSVGVALGQPIQLIDVPAGNDFLPVGSVVSRAAYPDLSARFPNVNNYTTSITVPVTGDRVGIATDGEIIILARFSSSNQIIISYDDGVSWGNVTMPTTSSGWRGLMYGNGVFVIALYASTTAYYSGTGTTWTSMTMPSASNWNNGVFGGGIFLMLPNGGTACARSTNGTSWTAGTLPNSGTWNIGFWDETRSQFFAHTTSATFYAATSSNGTTWSSATVSGLSSPSSGFTLPSGRYVVVGGTADYATSDDGGGSWTARTLPVSRSASWRAFSSSDGGRAIVQDGSATLLTTTDGITWVESTLPYSTAAWHQTTSVPGKSYALLTGRASLDAVLRVYAAKPAGDIVLGGPSGYYVRVR